MRAGYEALTTKVKAMYGKRLRYADYVRMARMGSVDEVFDDLRQHPVWGPAVGRLSEGGHFGRARLEGALREQLREEYVRLSAFIPRRDQALMEFPILRSELDGLLFTLARLQAGHTKDPEPLPVSFIRHSRTDEAALYVCTDYEGLLESTRGSIYYGELLRLRTPSGALPDYTTAESRLFTAYYTHMLDVVSKRYEGEVRKTLRRDIGAQVDMMNIMHILRLKRFFPREDNFMAVLYPVRCRLKPAQVRAMCAAADTEGVLALVEETPYGKTFRGASVADLERLYDETLFRLSRRQLMMGAPSIYSAVAFLNLRELELNELIRVVETVKYRVDYDDRAAMALGK